MPKLLGRDQPALGIDLQFKIHRPAHGLLANRASGNLHVLLADGIDDVARREISRCNLVRVEPDAHRIVARTEDFHVARAGNAGQHILHLQRGVVAQIDLIVTAIGRKQVDDHREVGRLLDGRYSQPAHLFGQFGQ